MEHSSRPLPGCHQGGRIEVYTDVTDRVLAEQEIHWLSTQTMQLVEKEKSRIASNLHDGLGQTILAIKFSLENIHESLKKQPKTFERQQADLKKTITWIENMGREVSSISSNLMPSMLGPLGLEETLTYKGGMPHCTVWIPLPILRAGRQALAGRPGSRRLQSLPGEPE